jgi:Asp-tRNA(Asn)/Glu-tRNA(Gln) amidotransferase A subunit family amidase
MRVSHCPFGKTVSDINLMMKAFLNNEYLNNLGPYAGNAYHMKRRWREEEVMENKKFTIGVIKSIPLFPATSTMQRAVDESAAALKKLGHKVVEVNFPCFEEIALIWIQTCAMSNAAKMFSQNLKGEPIIPEYKETLLAASVPKFMSGFVKCILGCLGEKRKCKLIDWAHPLTAQESLHLYVRQNKVVKEFLKVWEDNKLDAIILPGCATPAFKHTKAGDVPLAMLYTYILNILNTPAGAMPITVVKAGEDNYNPDVCPIKDSMTKAVSFNMQGSVGIPVGIQVATLPYQDEKCLNIMRQLEPEIGFYKKHPLPF